MNKLLSENPEERKKEISKLKSEGYSFKEILEFCKTNSKDIYDTKFVKIIMEKTIYIGNINLNYYIFDDFPEALDIYGTRDLKRVITIWNNTESETFMDVLFSTDIIDFERGFEDETAYLEHVKAMNKDIDIVLDKILNCKEFETNLIDCLNL